MGRELGQQSSLEVPTLPAHLSDPVYSTASQEFYWHDKKIAKYGAGAREKLASLLKPNLVKLHPKYLLWREQPAQ